VSDLSGLGVLVTGAHRGVGAAVAIAVAAAGASVICVDRRLCGETVATIRAAGGRAEIWQCDVADEDSVRALFDALADAQFRLDMVVHCARIAGDAPALDTATADFDRLMAVNLRGTFLVGRAAMGMMRGAGGRIVLIAAAVPDPAPGAGAFAASQAGVGALARAWAHEVGPDIAVNAVRPGSGGATAAARLVLLLAGPEGALLNGQVLDA